MTLSSGKNDHITKINYDYVHLSTNAASIIAISTTDGKLEKKAEKVTKTHSHTPIQCHCSPQFVMLHAALVLHPFALCLLALKTLANLHHFLISAPKFSVFNTPYSGGHLVTTRRVRSSWRRTKQGGCMLPANYVSHRAVDV
jgi:hypothetical protein